MSPRARPKLTNPADAALLINLLARYAADSPDKTPLDERVARGMRAIGQARTIAGRIVQNFTRVSVERRKAEFGNFHLIDLHRSPVELARLAKSARVSRSEVPSRIARDDVGEAVQPPDSPEDEFVLKYRGLYCNEESDWDRGSDSDEPYVLTSVVQINAAGENTVRSERHPHSQTCYEDVDSGEWRDGPVAACWKGRAAEISLICIVMEHDEGDPDAYKDDLTVIVNAAADIASSQGYDAPDSLKDVTVDFLNWLLGPGDDLIQTVYRPIFSSELRSFGRDYIHNLHGTRRLYTAGGFVGQPSYVEVHDETSVLAHFQTDHYGDGAHYVVGFEVERHPALHIPIIDTVRRHAETIARNANSGVVPNP